jgi:hypothetical protein
MALWAVEWSAASSARSLAALSSSELPPRLCVALSGSEQRRLPPSLRARSSAAVTVGLVGFGASLPLSVHAALVAQRLFALAPDARGDLCADPDAVLAVRREWYARLAKSDERRDEYAHYLAEPPPPLDELRRAVGDEEDEPHWLPKKVKKRIEDKEHARRIDAHADDHRARLLHVDGLDADDDADAMELS